MIGLQRNQWQPVVSEDLLSVPFVHSDYISATERIVARVAAISAEIGLYRFGSVGCPGISDLDFLCIVPKDIEKKALLRVEKILIDEPLATHGPFITENQRISDLPMFFPGIQLEHISGPNIISGHFDPYEPSEVRAFSTADIIEAGCRRWATLSTYRDRPTMGARKTLLTLWALTHLIASGNRVQISIGSQHRMFQDDVFELRNIVANGGKASPDSLSNLAGRGAALVSDLVSTAAKLAAAVQRDDTPMVHAVLAGRTLLLHSKEEELFTESVFLRMGHRSRRYEIFRLPHNVYAHFGRCITTPAANAPAFDHLVARRAAAITAYRNFLKRAGCHFAATPPSLYVPSRSLAVKALDQFVLCRIAGQERTTPDKLAT